MGTSSELWLNLQAKYDIYKIEIENLKNQAEEKEIYKTIDKNFLKTLGIIKENDTINDGIEKLRQASLVSSLTIHKNKDMLCMYRTSQEIKETDKNIICRNIWVSLATAIAKKTEVKTFDEKKLIENISIFRNMTTMEPSEFYPIMQEIFSECGVAFVLLPSLKNSNINGVVKWIEPNKVMMALNTRGAYNDKFWFSFFHELKHVLQKEKRKMIIGEETQKDHLDPILEYEADLFAKELLIPSEKLNKLIYFTENAVCSFAKRENIHPGIVVGRLQKEEKISYSQLNHLKVKYEIKITHPYF